MLSDEEKKAYDNLLMLKYFTMEKEDKQSIDIILNLIEKQSKEIEDKKLIDKNRKEIFEKYEKEKEKNKITKQMNENLIEVLKESISKDKIKAKIEELQKDIQYSANPLSIDNSKFGIKVLQSLLEKE